MALVTGTIEAVSHKFDKFSINVNGEWYSTKQEWAPSPEPNKGDTVSFDNGGKKFIKKLKVVGSGGAPSSSGGTGYSKPNLGIEVGHASNLAMRVLEMKVADNVIDANDDETLYKLFTEHTQNIYRLMQGIRKSIETGEATKSHMEGDLAPKDAKDSTDDIF